MMRLISRFPNRPTLRLCINAHNVMMWIILALLLVPVAAMAQPYDNPLPWRNKTISGGSITLDCHQFIGQSNEFGGTDEFISWVQLDRSVAGAYPNLLRVAPSGGSSDTLVDLAFDCLGVPCNCSGQTLYLTQQTPGTTITVNHVPGAIENIGGSSIIIDSADDIVMYIMGTDGIARQFGGTGGGGGGALPPNGFVKRAGAVVYLDENDNSIFDSGTELELLTSIGAGDNLGTHIATQVLNMSGFNITDIGVAEADSVSINDGADADALEWTIGPEDVSSGLSFKYGGVGRALLNSNGQFAYGGVVYPATCPADDSVFVIQSCSAVPVDKDTLGGGGGGSFDHEFTQDVSANGNDLLALGNLTMTGQITGSASDMMLQATGAVIVGSTTQQQLQWDTTTGRLQTLNGHKFTKKVMLLPSAFVGSGGCAADPTDVTVADYEVENFTCTHSPTQGVLTQKFPFVLEHNTRVTTIKVRATWRALTAGPHDANIEVGARCEGDNQSPAAIGQWGTFQAVTATPTTLLAPTSSAYVTITPIGSCSTPPFEYRLRIRTTDTDVQNAMLTYVTVIYEIDDLSYEAE